VSLYVAYALALTACVLTTVAQLLLKAGAESSRGGHPFRLWWNPWVLTAYATFFLVTLLSLKAFEVLPLKLMVILNSLILLSVVIGSRCLFGERLSSTALGGLALVLAGVVVFNL